MLPCARNSVLVPCPLSGPLRAPDPPPGDDDAAPGDAVPGLSEDMRAWLELLSDEPCFAPRVLFRDVLRLPD